MHIGQTKTDQLGKYKFPVKVNNTIVVSEILHELALRVEMKSSHDFPTAFGFIVNLLERMAYNSEQAATSAYVFMIQSLPSPLKEVVHIMSVKKIDGEKLFAVVKKTIVELDGIGFTVRDVVSDNNSINRKAMSKFSVPPKLSIVYPYLSDSSNPLFFVIDSGLQLLGEQHKLISYETTSIFISLICTWWKIVNVKTPLKGQHLLDPYQQPITLSPDNQTCEFLHKILSWLDSWKGKNCTTGTLTKETHLAFIHTTYALLEMSKYCINELKFQYFNGKIQTDALESRLGKYRTLSGSQYLISIRQLYEVEAKLRMQNFLPLTLVSNTYGQPNLKDIHLEDSCNETPLGSSVLHNFNITLSEKDFRHTQPYLPFLTYLAGICARAALKKLKCDFCSKSLVLNKSFELNSNYDLIRNLDRGSLLCPSPDVVTAVLYNSI
ncbi:transposable element P transposase [Trichonephila inaurata madagascariensis]|uniref:Transposable element P transposase n=1 Tax=Trichonephila inaurata madagascariensis TaxID=2747483 RepID=A0A8X6Y5J0_9ARAC|nr:transposable element P transposase [Trichonephila inaurata madagascariensis]